MQVTTAGKIFFASVLLLLPWSSVIAWKWARRVAAGRPPDALTLCFLFGVVFTISSLFFPFAYWIPKSLYALAAKPTYSAEIVSYSSEWVETRKEDSDGRSYTSRTLMHRPQVSFTDNQGRHLVLDSSTRSARVPVVGKHMTVVHADGDSNAQEKSMRVVMLYLAALLMVFLLGFVLLTIVAYALNRPMQGYTRFARLLIWRILLPLGTMAMLAMLAYPVFSYFLLGNPDDLPTWVIVICSVFALALLPLVYHILTGWKAYQRST